MVARLLVIWSVVPDRRREIVDTFFTDKRMGKIMDRTTMTHIINANKIGTELFIGRVIDVAFSRKPMAINCKKYPIPIPNMEAGTVRLR